MTKRKKAAINWGVALSALVILGTAFTAYGELRSEVLQNTEGRRSVSRILKEMDGKLDTVIIRTEILRAINE